MLCAVWWLAAAVEILLLVITPHSALHDGELTLIQRASLLGHDLTAAGLLIAAVIGPVIFAGRATANISWLRGFFKGLIFPATWLILVAWGMDWTCFVSQRSYLNRAAIGFWMDQPLEMFYSANQAAVIVVPVAALILAGWLMSALPWWLGGKSPAYLGKMQIVTGLSFLACVVSWQFGQTMATHDARNIGDPQYAALMPMPRYYRRQRDHAAGSFAHLAGALIRPAGGDDKLPLPEGGIEPRWIPRISHEQYLATVDRAKALPMNVIMAMIDPLAPGSFKCYGGEISQYPGIDALAGESQRFETAYANADHGNYSDVVGPGGHYPLRAVYTHVYPPNPTYPRVLLWDLLKPLGWRTAMFAAGDLRPGGVANYLDTGKLDKFQFQTATDPPDIHQQALQWIATGKNEPKLLYLKLTPQSKTFLDDLIETLKQTGQWEKTILLISGTRGEPRNEHQLTGEGQVLYQEMVRVPLLIRVPGLPGKIWRRPAQQVDIAPTIAGLLNVPLHPGWQGLDLLGADFPAERSIYLTTQSPIANQAAIIRGRYKMIYDVNHQSRSAYDLLSDPGETIDVMDFVERKKPELGADLRDRLDAWRFWQIEYYRDPFRQGRYYPPRVE